MSTLEERIAQQEARLKELRAKKRERDRRERVAAARREREREQRDALTIYRLLVEHDGWIAIGGRTLTVADALAFASRLASYDGAGVAGATVGVVATGPDGDASDPSEGTFPVPSPGRCHLAPTTDSANAES